MTKLVDDAGPICHLLLVAAVRERAWVTSRLALAYCCWRAVGRVHVYVQLWIGIHEASAGSGAVGLNNLDTGTDTVEA